MLLKKSAFIVVAADAGPLIINRLDIAKHPLGNFGVGADILRCGAYTADEVISLAKIMEQRSLDHGNGVVAVDCGANIGSHAISWARAMTGWGSVVAIEAQERLFYALCGNIVLNNCWNARAIWAAVGAENGTLRTPVPNYAKAMSFGSLPLRIENAGEEIGQEIDYAPDAMVPVPALTLDSLGLDRCDVIKVDVEGMELDVLQGARETIARCRPILFVEMIKCDRRGVVGFLQDAGYDVGLVGQMNVIAAHREDPTREWIDIPPL